MKKSIFIILLMFLNVARADWSESYGGDGVVSSFIMIARSLAAEMQKDSANFDTGFTAKFNESINQTIVSSADRLYLDGIEKDAINHTLVKPYKIEISRSRWLQYDLSISTQEKLVLHEYLFTLRMDDSNYELSNMFYKMLINARLNNNDYNRLGPHFLSAASECNSAKVFNIISLGVNINYKDLDGHNALYEAANAGCAELVSKFLLMDIPFLKTTYDFWDPTFAAFVRSHQIEYSSEFKQYERIFHEVNLAHDENVDRNREAFFDAREFPPQLNWCSGQTMLMRSIIGITFFTDNRGNKTKLVRNPEMIKLLLREGGSRNMIDGCKKSANDYAKEFNIDLNAL